MSEDEITLEPGSPALGGRRSERSLEAGGHGFALRGQSLGPYRVLDLLGEGGFGAVYLAEQTTPVQRRVAVKVIKPGMDSRSVLARFEAERQALALMDHPSVAKVFDAGLTPQGRPFFAMELVRGQPITRYCELERANIDERLRLMIQVCAAVHHAHMKGVVHRDLKPSNILVELMDGRPLVKVIDFGVAKALHQPLSESTIFTELGQMIGTPEYVSPEQARGSADVDTRADVYALGVILYELLTGVTPVDSRSLRDGGYAGLQRTLDEFVPAAPSARLSGLIKAGEGPATRRSIDMPGVVRRVRGELDWIVMKCLEKERSRRYASALALADDLQRHLKHEPVLAGPPSATYRAAKFIRRHRVAVAGGVAVLLALVAGIIGTGYGLAEAVRERELARFQATAADRARDESEAVTRFLTMMIESVHPEEAGRDVTVREVLDAASERLAETFDERPAVEARLRHALGVSYWQLGRLDDAEKHLPAVVNIRRAMLGPDHLDTLRATVNLASLRMEQRRDREAEELLRQAVDGLTRAVGADHALTLGALSNLAVLVARQGPTEQTLQLHQQVLDGQRRAHGPDHPHTLGAMINLADVLVDLNRLDQAEPILREAVASWERAHGPEKPGTLLALHSLAMLELQLGRADQAELLMRRVVEARRRVLGEQHIETLNALANLGLVHSQRGNLADAEAAYATAWHGLRDSLGVGHPTTLMVAGQLAGVIESQGWPTRTADLVAELINSARQAMQTADIGPSELNNLAWLLSHAEPAELRDLAAALTLATRCCDHERQRQGGNLWMYLDTLATIQFLNRSYVSALASQREAIERMPASAEAYRAEMEQRLRQYEQSASSSPTG